MNLVRNIPLNSLEFQALRENKLLRPSLKIWRTSLPLSKQAVGGFIDKAMENIELVEDVAIANATSSANVKNFGWDVLDAQYWFRHEF